MQGKNKINDLLEKVNLDAIITVIFSFIYFFSIYKKNGIMYSTNDDIAMRSIVSGIYLGGEQSTQMIFAGFPFNVIVFFFYNITNKLDWYGIILIGLTIFYLSYTIFNILKQKKDIVQKIVCACGIFFVISTLYSTFLVDITFTVVAAFIVTCCLVLYILPPNKLKNLIISIGIILSFGIRAKACLMVLIFFLPIFLYKSVYNKNNIKKDLSLGLKIGAVLVMCIIVQKIMVSDIQWKKYLTYNENRSLFYDYYYDSILNLPEEEQLEIFYNAGFTYEEMEVLRSKGAIGFLNNVPERMSNLIVQCKEHGLKLNSNIKSSYEDLIKNTESIKYYLITLFIFGYYTIKSKDRKIKIPLFLIFMVFQFSIILYLVYQGRLLDRVVIPLFASYIIMNISILLNEENFKRIVNKIINYDKIFFIIISIIVYIYSINSIRVDESTRIWTDEANNILEYFAENPDNLYIYDRNSLENFKLVNTYTANNYLNMSGWSTFSPLHTKKINKYDANTLTELLFEENVYLVIPYSLEDNNEKYNFLFKDYTIELIDKFEFYHIYKFKNK